MIDIKYTKDCCGCWACIQVCPKKCINMSEDNEGFLYPGIDLSLCIDCGLCEKVCPVIHQGKERIPLKVYAAKSCNERIRLESSSGGVFTLLAEKIITSGGVVFGARFDSNWEVVHDCVESIDALSALRGSKYVQSRIEDTFKKAECCIKEGREVLFCGTPCQISGLKLFLRKEYDNLIAVDFICHGVPSPGVWRQYLDEEFGMSERSEDRGKNTVLPSPKALPILGISFRDKQSGWKKFSFVVRGRSALKADKNSVLLSDRHYDNPFMKAFLSDLILRPSCYCCPAKGGKSGSDITLADYWGIQNVFPGFDDDKGVSAVMVNTLKGKRLFDMLCIEKHDSSYDYITKYNPSVLKSVAKSVYRETFMDFWASGRKISDISEELTEKMKPTFLQRVVNKFKRILLK